MKVGRLVVGIFGVVLFLGCVAKQPLTISEEERSVFAEKELDSVLIANKESEYEIVIIEPGFYNWLITIARPEGYYSQTFLENRNQVFVINWNNRVLLPGQFDSNLYVLPIDYDPSEDYGYEVNYKLYNYFIYFQRRYNQRLGPWVPRL